MPPSPPSLTPTAALCSLHSANSTRTTSNTQLRDTPSRQEEDQTTEVDTTSWNVDVGSHQELEGQTQVPFVNNSLHALLARGIRDHGNGTHRSLGAGRAKDIAAFLHNDDPIMEMINHGCDLGEIVDKGLELASTEDEEDIDSLVAGARDQRGPNLDYVKGKTDCDRLGDSSFPKQ